MRLVLTRARLPTPQGERQPLVDTVNNLLQHAGDAGAKGGVKAKCDEIERMIDGVCGATSIAVVL